MKFKVEMFYAYDWHDAGWEEDDKPMRFDSVEAAQAAIDEFISDITAEVEAGNLMDGHSRDEFRVVPVPEGEP